ncbi:hypothetical protein GCM10011594_38550 [Nakamurella endophytica]|uniref:Transcriptional regulator LacI/GalR-like sensor domain-containing protein n=1 Tax=Nakamurella endophytica TaxID=1748367 RepID=A0A917WMQ1_9ACTN|nr:hypothetical protein GCM10011594_38550 [Nakamurella endophytica]
MRVLLGQQVDGHLIAPTPLAAHRNRAVETIAGSGRPVVLIDRLVPGVAADAVISDDREASRRLTSVLLDDGHRAIGFLSSLPFDGRYRAGDFIPSTPVADRVSGYLDALAAVGLPSVDGMVRLKVDRTSIQADARTFLTRSDRPTAVIASDSRIGLALFRAARDLSMDIPGQLSLVVFDNADWTDVAAPGITVMSQPMRDIGAQAALLIDRIEGAVADPRVVVLPQRLVERASVSRPPAAP